MGPIEQSERWLAECTAIMNEMDALDWNNFQSVDAALNRVRKLSRDVSAYAETPDIIRRLQDKIQPKR